MGNVLAVVSDRKLISAGSFYVADVLTLTDYYAFGQPIAERTYAANGAYRYGFNGQEKDNELYGEGNAYDFGARINDPRLGRWLSLDPLAAKYPSMSPYNSMGNNPILFVDPDGRDFGVIINHEDKTIIIVTDIYTISEKGKKQAQLGAVQWNEKTTKIDGYTVSFLLTVKDPTTSLFGNPIDEKNSEKRILAANTGAGMYGNVYAGNKGKYTQIVEGKEYVAGVTLNSKIIFMHTHTRKGDMGDKEKLVAHEIGHILGLDDEDGDDDGVTDPYYGGSGGIMEYGAPDDTFPISHNDIEMIIKYTRDALADTEIQKKGAKVHIITETGKNEKSPLKK